MEVFRVWGTILLKGADKVKRELGAVDASAKGIAGNLDTAGRKMKEFGATAGRVGSTLTRAVTLPIMALGGLMLKTGMDFEKAMTSSLAIMGDVSDEMREKMERAARDVAKTTRFTANQAAQSYFYLASAGLDAAQSIEALPIVAAFAQAGSFDMALATDLLTDAQSALGMTIKDDVVANMENMVRVSDVLVKANTLANATVQQFSESLTNKAGAAARLLNKDVSEVVAVLSVMADQGLKGAAAGESLNIVMRDLQKASIENRKEFDKHNVVVYDANGNMRNMAEIIGDLERALKGMSDEQVRTTLMSMGFQERSVSATMALLGTSDAIRQYEKALVDAGGTTKEVSAKQLNNLSDAFGLLKSRIADAGIAIFNTLKPMIQELLVAGGPIDSAIKKVQDLAAEFAGLSREQQLNVVKWGLLAAAVGPAMLIFNGMFTLVGNLLIALGFLAKHPAFLAVAALMYAIVRVLDAVEKQKQGKVMTAGKVKPLWETDHEIVEEEGYVGLDGTRYDAAGNVLAPRREFVDVEGPRYHERPRGGGEWRVDKGAPWEDRFAEALIQSRYAQVAPDAGTSRSDMYEEELRRRAQEQPEPVPGLEQGIPIFHDGGEFKAPPGRREGLAMLEHGERVVPPGGSLLPDRITIDVNVNVTGGTLDEEHLTRVASAGLMELIRRGDRRLPNRAALTGVTW